MFFANALYLLEVYNQLETAVQSLSHVGQLTVYIEHAQWLIKALLLQTHLNTMLVHFAIISLNMSAKFAAIKESAIVVPK